MPDRIKDKQEVHNHYLDGVDDNMKSFYTELTQIYPGIRVTSGKRKTSPSGKFSHHHTGKAIDIGREHADVYNFLMNDRKGLELLNKHGLGIIDETDPATMEKTHATAPHFHIGPDNAYRKVVQDRLKNFDNLDVKLSYNSKSYTPPVLPNSTPEEVMQPLPTYEKPMMELPGGVFITQQDLVKEVNKEEVNNTKTQKSEARQELVKEQENKKTLLEEINNLAPTYSLPEVAAQPKQVQETGYAMQNIQLDNSLPQLPNIFTFS